ncbi:MAG: PglZ domain-containing protein [Promethearchaeota archaeon]
MEIKIILDKTKQIEAGDRKIYLSEQDYFDAYTYLRKCIKEKNDQETIVYSEPLKNWLFTSLKKYKNANISVRDVNYKDLLAAKWKIEYDIEISDYEIKRDDLLSLPVEGLQNQPFTSFICQNFISSYLDKNEFHRNAYGKLISDLLRYYQQKDKLPQIVHTVYQFKINQWSKNSSSYSEIIQLMGKDIIDLYNKSSLYLLIKKYPLSFQEKCLDRRWIKHFSESKLNFNDLHITYFKQNSNEYKILLSELEIFFQVLKEKIKDKQSLEDLLKYLSGEIEEELEYVLEILQALPELISKKIIAHLKIVFRPILQFYRDKMEKLYDFIPPPKPSDFDKLKNLDEAILWAVKEYLPYKFWLENTKKTDFEILKEGAKFSDYIFDNYEYISYHYSNSIFRFIFNNKEIIRETDYPVLLIIDNFNYKYLEKLKSLFLNHGFVPLKIDPYLSLLPSETSIGKVAILSGKRDKIDVEQVGYEKNLIKQWQTFFPEHRINYISKAGELEDYKVKGKEFIVINYLAIDDELHKSYQKTAIEHRRTVNFILNNIIDLIVNFIKKNKIENKSRIFLISDHGSTFITEDIPNEIDFVNFKGLSIDEKHRFLKVKKIKFEQLKRNQNIVSSLYFLNKEISGDGNYYLIARAYNRFKDISEEFYIHGGALSEEVIVPGGYFEYKEQKEKPLRLQLLKNEFRFMVKDSIELRLANPNNIPAADILIAIFANDVLAKEIIIENLSGLKEKYVQDEFRLINKNTNKILVNLSYELSGKIFKEHLEFPIKVKTFAKTKFDFDEFLE